LGSIADLEAKRLTMGGVGQLHLGQWHAGCGIIHSSFTPVPYFWAQVQAIF
jgi:hypothetical protein